MHVTLEPAIHYWGTPVVLVSTLNEDGSPNVAPMSSAWWLGWSCMLGLDASSQTTLNLRRQRECVLNLASEDDASRVDRLALTTRASSIPIHKKLLGYRHVADKLGHAGLSALASEAVAPPRVAECQVHLEAVVERIDSFARNDPRMAVPACAIEVRIVRAHVAEELVVPGTERIDPDKWRPLVMSFRELRTLGPRARESRLARGPEEAYAPWKRGGLAKLAGKALGAWSRFKYEP